VLQRGLGHDPERLEYKLGWCRYAREGLTRSGAASEGTLWRDEGGAA
jgi:hypothetical protein